MKTQRYASLAGRAAGNYLSSKPLCISFEITHNCNAFCRHCHLGGRNIAEKRAPAEEFGEICRRLRPVIAQISGGEPLLRRDLTDIVKAFRRPDRAPVIVITTNAALLTYDRYRELRAAGVDEFSISLDYPDERHDDFRGIPGLFGKIRTLIERISGEAEKGVTFCCVIQSDNFRDLPRLAELAGRWGVRLNLSAYTMLRTKETRYLISPADLREFKEVVHRLKEIKKTSRALRTSSYVLDKMAEYFDRGGMPRCQTGRRFFNVNPDGTFSPCGLIITDFKSARELRDRFCRSNACVSCYTSIRANTEKPVWRMLYDNIAGR
jgi:MoaA/NifB/PqqE/SkfB family radical SAM enzyme